MYFRHTEQFSKPLLVTIHQCADEILPKPRLLHLHLEEPGFIERVADLNSPSFRCGR